MKNWGAAISDGVFEAGRAFWLVLTKFSFSGGDWPLGYHSMGFRHCPNFLISYVLSRSATCVATRMYHVYK